jgi:hypothetical protein
MNSLKDLSTVFIIKNNINYTPETLTDDCIEYVEFIKTMLLYLKSNKISKLITPLSKLDINLVKYLFKSFNIKLHPLMWDWCMYDAAKNGHLEVVKYCAGKGYNIIKMCIETARENNHDKIVKFLQNYRYKSL